VRLRLALHGGAAIVRVRARYKAVLAAVRAAPALVARGARAPGERTLTFDGKRILITGGTGSLGRRLTLRLLGGTHGRPARITIFSRDEANQHDLRQSLERRSAGNEPLRDRLRSTLEFRLGDVRDYAAVLTAVRNADIVVHAAALKQVPACERFPFQAVQTNVIGAEHIVRAVLEQGGRIEAVVGISSDKACKPVSVMGTTKALMERLFTQANMDSHGTRFCCIRFGNVLASRVPCCRCSSSRSPPADR
jgi:UDP-glucose 4-epimerase